MRIFVPASLALLFILGGCATDGSGGVEIGLDAGVSAGWTANFAPPPLPVYDQPPIPGDGYIWTPGYWGWNAAVSNYYWTPGAWVLPPRAGVLWTPGYWGWRDGVYAFHAGYWGPHVGFYGGINYGFGYGGSGFGGGEWRGGHFFYNRSVSNISNVKITNVYSRTVIINNAARTSFNGGAGVRAEPRPEELAAARETHLVATPEQQRHFQAARAEPGFRADLNHGTPPVAAMAHAGGAHGPGPGEGAPHEAMVRPTNAGPPAMGEPRGPQAHAAPESAVQPVADRRQPGGQGFERPPANAAHSGAPGGAAPGVRPAHGPQGPAAPRGPRPGGHPGGGRPAGHPGGGHPGGGHPGGGRPGGGHPAGHPGGGHPNGGGHEGGHH